MKRLTTTHAMSPLTPVSFLDRAAAVHGDKVAVVDGSRSFTYREVHQRCRQLAGALVDNGLQPGARVAVLSHNTREMLEGHYGVPYAAGVLVPINSRLSAGEIAYILQHSEADVVIATDALTPLAAEAISLAGRSVRTLAGSEEYEATIAAAEPVGNPLTDELSPLAINYTSGTTGKPKGVVYSHRGAYLQSLAMAFHSGMDLNSSYLWTLPMFHCNGWCFPWTIAARAGVNVCLRKFEPKLVFDLMRDEGVTHYCAAPIVHTTLVNAPPSWREGLRGPVRGMVAGAPPPAAVLAQMEAMGFELTHVYGLTEVYGPAAVCAEQDEWRTLPEHDRATMKARQGVRYHLQSQVAVLNPETMQPVPADGETIGEIMFRGNICMKGYLKNEKATREAFAGGWFHTGDLGVCMPDGYIKIKDRSKDIIISGGENISSVEVEDALYRHPAVLAAAVVAQPDAKWGETPCAFVELKDGATATAEDLIAHCKTLLAGFKVPKAVFFGPLPKTSTGKIQKYELRRKVKSTSAIDV